MALQFGTFPGSTGKLKLVIVDGKKRRSIEMTPSEAGDAATLLMAAAAPASSLATAPTQGAMVHSFPPTGFEILRTTTPDVVTLVVRSGFARLGLTLTTTLGRSLQQVLQTDSTPRGRPQ